MESCRIATHTTASYIYLAAILSLVQLFHLSDVLSLSTVRLQGVLKKMPHLYLPVYISVKFYTFLKNIYNFDIFEQFPWQHCRSENLKTIVLIHLFFF